MKNRAQSVHVTKPLATIVGLGLMATLTFAPAVALADESPANPSSETPIEQNELNPAQTEEGASTGTPEADEKAPEDSSDTSETDEVSKSGTAAASGEESGGNSEADKRAVESTDENSTPAPVASPPAKAPTAPTKEAENEEPTEPPADPEVVETTTTTETTDVATPVSKGAYAIETGIANDKVVDVQGGKAANGTNVQIYQSNSTNAQKWEFEYHPDATVVTTTTTTTNGEVTNTQTTTEEKQHWYIIKSLINKGMVLGIVGNNAQSGSNVALCTYDKESDAQRWEVVKNGGGYLLKSRLSKSLGYDLVLDVKWAEKANGTNIRVYEKNGTDAQRFYLLDVDGLKTVDEATKDPFTGEKRGDVVNNLEGVYTIKSKKDTSYVLDVASGSTKNGANVQLYKSNNTGAQKYYLHKGADGWYTIGIVGSSAVLDAKNGSYLPGTNVQQFKPNGSQAQQWAIRKNTDGSYSFVNRKNGLTLDVANGTMKNGTNVRLWHNNGSQAESFTLTSADFLTGEKGIYTISSMLNRSKVLDIQGGSAANGARVQLYQSNDSLAQRFELQRVGSNLYRIRTAASGGWLTLSDTSGVQATQQGSSKTQSSADLWTFVWNGVGFGLQNDKLVLDARYGSSANGTVIQGYTLNGTAAQCFFVQSAQLLRAGTYEIANASNKRLDVVNASSANGANVRIDADRNTLAQMWNVKVSGSNYIITSTGSGKALEVKGGSKANGANVQQYQANSSASQLWRAEIADGGYVNFVNVNSGKVLDVAGGSTANGANVQQWSANGTSAQKWKLVPTSLDSSNSSWVTMLRVATRKTSSKTNYMVLVDRTHHLIGVLKRESKSAPWYFVRRGSCAVGRATSFMTTTPLGDAYVCYHKYQATKDGYTDWYHTHFKNPSKGITKEIHSVLFKAGSKTKLHGSSGLGTNKSYGCVRVLLDLAEYIYKNVPMKSRVHVYGAMSR